MSWGIQRNTCILKICNLISYCCNNMRIWNVYTKLYRKKFLHLIIWDFSLFKKDCHMTFIHTPLVPLFNETISLWVFGPSAQRHSTPDCPKTNGSLYQLFWTDRVVTKRFQLLQLDIFKLRRIHKTCFWYQDHNEPQLV